MGAVSSLASAMNVPMSRKSPNWKKSNTNHKRGSVLGLHAILRVVPLLPNLNRKHIHQLPETSLYTYPHLLLSRLHSTPGDIDHWQNACRILKCLEYSEEHTLELVWLVDSIHVYTPRIEEDFTTQIVEFIQGVVVYLTKFPGDERNGDLLRTATVMAEEWLISRQSSENGTSHRRGNTSYRVRTSSPASETFDLVENKGLSPSESHQRTINLYQDSQKTDPSADLLGWSARA